MKICLVGLLSLSLVGCASPLVKYEENPKPGATGYPFKLSETVLKFSFAEEGSGATKGVNSSKMAIVSVPVEIEKPEYSIEGAGAIENWGVKTNINATSRGDTKLLQELGVKVTDNRKQVLTDIGSAAITAISLFAQKSSSTGSPGQAIPPEGLYVSKLLKNSTCKPRDNQNKNTGVLDCDVELDGGGILDSGKKVIPYKAKIIIGEISTRALKKSELKFPLASDSVFYSSCRSLMIKVTNSENPNLVAYTSLVVADPDWVEFVKLTVDSKVTFGASCGANIVSQDSTLPSAVDYINAGLGIAKAYKDSK